MIKNYQLFENNTFNKIINIQKDYDDLENIIIKYIDYQSNISFSKNDCSLEWFYVNDSGGDIDGSYTDWNFDTNLFKIKLDDFSLFYNDEDKYKKEYDLRKNTNKFNL